MQTALVGVILLGAQKTSVPHERAKQPTTDAQAWMRARGDSATEVFTAESMAERFGVEKGSYESVPLPADVVVQQVILTLARRLT